MYHSLIIGVNSKWYNTWDDWHLIPLSRPLVNAPSIKRDEIDIPGGDGSIDLTTAFSGRPLYTNRTGSWSFLVENGFKEWYNMFSELMGVLHGQEVMVILEDDLSYFYKGRLFVNQWRSEAANSIVAFDYNLEPYKYDLDVSSTRWIWDTFNFTNGIIREYNNLPVRGSLTIPVISGKLQVIPYIVASSTGMSLLFDGNTYTLKQGGNYISDVLLVEGENLFTFTGYGFVTIEYRSGML